MTKDELIAALRTYDGHLEMVDESGRAIMGVIQTYPDRPGGSYRIALLTRNVTHASQDQSQDDGG